MRVIFSLSLILLLAACQQGVPPEALELSAPPTELRKLSSRNYETADERKILLASAGVLQDLEFNITESATKLGVVTASKSRDATDAGEMAGLFVLAVLGSNPNAMNGAAKDQLIKAAVVTKKEDKKTVNVRVTFQRIVTNQGGQIHHIETIKDPEIYQQFFEKLSKSIFLEGENI